MVLKSTYLRLLPALSGSFDVHLLKASASVSGYHGCIGCIGVHGFINGAPRAPEIHLLTALAFSKWIF